MEGSPLKSKNYNSFLLAHLTYAICSSLIVGVAFWIAYSKDPWMESWTPELVLWAGVTSFIQPLSFIALVSTYPALVFLYGRKQGAIAFLAVVHLICLYMCL